MHTVYEDRIEAGRRLAKKLTQYHGTDTLIIAIPRGGVPVAAMVAHRLQLPWNVIASRKLPIPWNPEAGFGAVTSDGSVVLNESIIHGLGLRKEQVLEIVEEVRKEVIRRAEVNSRERPGIDVSGKSIILVDDGVASGYTMLAAIKSLRSQGAGKIIAAAPVASRSAAAMIEGSADESVFEIVSPSIPFTVADFYLNWHRLSAEDMLTYLREK